MSRKPRIHYPGALYHIILRGNAQDDVFYDAVDRTKFCLLVQEGTERFRHRIHAFCLLDNHVHMALQVGEKPLSRIMQNLTFRYTQWFNRRHKRVGHLFQGRYKANLVDADSYLLELTRYIHLNPYRAKITRKPEKYRWSSYRFYIKDELPWLTTEFVLGQFSDDIGRANRSFRKFVDEGKTDAEEGGVFDPTHSDGRLIGDDQFMERVQESEDAVRRDWLTLDDIISSVCKVYGMKREELSASGKNRTATEARSMVALIAQDHPKLTVTEAAAAFQRDTSSLSAGAKRLRERLRSDNDLQGRFNTVVASL